MVVHRLSLETKVLFRKLVEGVGYLHKSDIVHRDLKLQNVVLSSLDSPKIIDFGFARKGINLNFESGCGTANYMSPELLSSSNGKRAFKADIWALGIILFYLLTKKYPFRCRLMLITALNENELYHKIRHEKLSLRLVKDESACRLLDVMLSKNQDHRPNCDEILRHEWLCSSGSKEDPLF